jgi:hypothetical protein
MTETATLPDEASVAATEAAMSAAGVQTEQPIYEDYFGAGDTHRVMLPDGRQYIEHTELSEGGRRKYLNSVNRDVVIQRTTGDAKMRVAPGDERYALLKTAITGWSLIKGGSPLPFSKQNLEDFLDKAPSRIIDLIEKDVRKHNDWLDERSLEDMERELEQLQSDIERKRKEEAGN